MKRNWLPRGDSSRHAHLSPPRRASTPPRRPSLLHLPPSLLHSSRRQRAGGPAAARSEPSDARRERSQDLQGTYLMEGVQRRPQQAAPGLPRAQAAPATGADSLTPRFRAVTGHRRGARGRPANRVAPLSANQPIASRRRRKFEWQLHAPRSAPSNDAPNSNVPGPLAGDGRGGGAAGGSGGTRGAIAQQKGRRSTSGTGPSPASLGLRHGGQ